MNKLKLSVITFIVLMAVAVTGCTKIKNYTKVNRDGSGTMTMSIKIDKASAVARMGNVLSESDVDSFYAQSGYQLTYDNGTPVYYRESSKQYGAGELIRGITSEQAVRSNMFYLYSEVDGQQLKQQLKQ